MWFSYLIKLYSRFLRLSFMIWDVDNYVKVYQSRSNAVKRWQSHSTAHYDKRLLHVGFKMNVGWSDRCCGHTCSLSAHSRYTARSLVNAGCRQLYNYATSSVEPNLILHCFCCRLCLKEILLCLAQLGTLLIIILGPVITFGFWLFIQVNFNSIYLRF